MSSDNLIDRLGILLAKYDACTDPKNNSSVKVSDMTELGILRRENQKLNEIIYNQKEIIDIFKIKYLDISLEYNEKIEKIRSDHLNELKNLHTQFREKLRHDRTVK